MKKQFSSTLASLVLPLASYGGITQSAYYQRSPARPGFSESVLPTTDGMAGLQKKTVERASVDDPDSLNIVEGSQARELLIIDEAVPDKATFYRALKPGVAIAEISSDDNGLERLRAILADHQDLDAVHIVSHAEDGVVHLGKSRITADAVKADMELFAALSGSVKAGGDLLFYGCNLAATEKGEELLDIIAGSTHVDVAASNNLTGSEDKGGDWVLEIARGKIEADMVFGEKSLKDFSAVLALETYNSDSFCASGCGFSRSSHTSTDSDFIFSGTASGTAENVYAYDTFRPNGGLYLSYQAAGNGDTSGSLIFSASNDVYSFELTSLVYSSYAGYSCSGGSIVGYVAGGGTVSASLNWSGTGNSAALGSFSGVQITRFHVNGTGCSPSAYQGMEVASFTVDNKQATNSPPTDISLDATAINQNVTGAGAVIGNLSTTDADSADTHTYALVANSASGSGSCGVSGDDHNASFQVDNANDDLETAGSLMPGTYNVCVQTSDGTDSYQESFSITVPVDSDGNLVAAGGVTEPVSLGTTIDTVGEAVDLFDFTLTDGSTSDGVAMDVSEVRIHVSGTSTDAERLNITWRLNGPDAGNVIGTYSPTTDTITFPSLTISVANGGSETYTLNAYYNDNTGLTEDHTIILSVDGDTDLTVDGAGTQMGTTSAVTNGTGTTIDVVATALVFSTQPAGSISGSALSTQPVVEAQDAFGNTDVDFSETITLTEASAGALSNGSQTASSGVATFTNLIYTATADQQSFTLTANDQDIVGSNLNTVDANAVTSDVVASGLTFTTEPAPTSIASGESTAFSTVPVVSAVDSQGVVDTGYSTDISLAVTDPNDGVVDGTVNSMTGTGDGDGNSVTVTLPPSSGVATFTALALQYTNSAQSEQIALRATSGGLTSANSTTITAVANAAPSFDSGASSSLNLDEGDGATAIDSLLGVTDTDSGDTLTWSVSASPSKGTLGGFPTTETADGGSVSPSGLIYTPDAEATGSDSFDVEISDGTSSDIITVNVDIDARPTVTLSSASGDPTNASPFDITVAFSESVTGFASGDVIVTNGSVNGVSGSGASYLVSVTPSADGAVTVDIVEAAAQDDTGKDSKAATQLSVNYDSTAPVPSLTSDAAGDTINAPVDVTVDFGETVSNFTVGGLDVTNGGLSGFTDLGGGVFELTLTPSGASEVTLTVPAGVAEDEAGNNNDAGNTLTYTYDGSAPVLQSTSPADNGTDVPRDTALVLEFNEAMVAGTGQITVTDLTDSEVHTTLSISDGQVSINSGQVTVTLGSELVPTHEYSVRVAAGSLLDEAGNSWAGISNDADFSFTVANATPQAVNDTLTVTQGQQWAVDVLANDSDSDGRLNSASVRVVDGPDHGRALVDTGTGTIRYVADAHYVGADSLTYVVEDEFGGESAAATLAITVEASDAPPATRADTVTTAPGQPAVIDLLANDLPGQSGMALEPASVTVVKYPANGSAEVNGAGELTYTPDDGFTGAEQLVYTVADTGGIRSAATTVFLNSVSGDAAPVAVDDSSTTGFGSQVVIDVLGNDSVAGDVLDTATIEVTRAPRHGVVDLTATPGQVTYQPDTGFRGEDHFRYVVRSQGGVVSNAAEVTVSVAEDGAPAVLDDYVQRLDGATLAINVLGNDRGLSAALDPSTLAVASGPGQGTVVLDGADDVFRYTPDDAFSGTDTFTYTVRDLDNTVSQSATVTISDVAVNPAPIANDQYVFVSEDSPATLSVLVNDQALGGNLDGSSLVIVESPEQGGVTLDGSGEVLYTPVGDAFGEARFRYTVRDSNGITTEPATVRLVIVPVAEAPLISGTPEPTVPAGTRYRFTPVATDVDGKPLTFSVTNLPSWASFDAGNGRITGTPALGDIGTTSGISITASNGEKSTALAAFDLRVTDNSGGSDDGAGDDPVSPVAPGDSADSGRQVVDPSAPSLDEPVDGWPAYTDDQPPRPRYELSYTDINGVPRSVTVTLDDASAPLPGTGKSVDGGQVLTFSQGSGDEQVIEIDPDGTTLLRQGSAGDPRSELVSDVIDLEIVSFANGTLRSTAVVADGDEAEVRVVIDQPPTNGVTVSVTNTDGEGNDTVSDLEFYVDGADIALAVDGSVSVAGIPVGGHEGIEYRIAPDGSAGVFGQFPDGSGGSLTSAITAPVPGSTGVVDNDGFTLMAVPAGGSNVLGELGTAGQLLYEDTSGSPANLPKGNAVVLEPAGGTAVTVDADPDLNGLGRAAEVVWTDSEGTIHLGRLEVTDLDAGNSGLYVEEADDGNGFKVFQSLSGLGDLASRLFLDGSSLHTLTSGIHQPVNKVTVRVPFAIATRYSDRVTLVSDAGQSILMAELLADNTTRHEVAAEGESTRARSNLPGTRTTLDTDSDGGQRVVTRAATGGRSFTLRADENGEAVHRNVNRSGDVTEATFLAPGTYTLLTRDGTLRSQARLGDGARCAWVETFANGETGTGYGRYDSATVQCVGIDSPTSSQSLFESGAQIQVDGSGGAIIVETTLTRSLRF